MKATCLLRGFSTEPLAFCGARASVSRYGTENTGFLPCGGEHIVLSFHCPLAVNACLSAGFEFGDVCSVLVVMNYSLSY
jgi:hypothetical protein